MEAEDEMADVHQPGEDEGPSSTVGQATEDPDQVDELPGRAPEAAVDRVPFASRRAWLAAAAVLLMGVVGVVVVLRDGGRSTTTAGSGPPDYLVADWLPEGSEPLYATSDAASGNGVATPTGEIVVYGDASLDDPWTGPVLSATRRDGVDPSDVWYGEQTEEITIGDLPGIVEDRGEVVSARPIEGDHYVEVKGYGFERDLVVAAAEHLTPDPAVGPEGLPDGYDEIARGPVTALASTLGSFDGLAVAYGPPGADEPGLMLIQQPADRPDAAALVRLMAREPDVENEDEVTEVRGQTAYVLRSRGSSAEASASSAAGSTGGADAPSDGQDSAVLDGEVEPTLVQWYEPAQGLVVTVAALGADQSVLDQFIEELRVADDDELDRLLDRYGEPPPQWQDDGEDAASSEQGSGQAEVRVPADEAEDG